MAWNDVIESSNAWSDLDFALYVIADYWVAGYTEDLPSTWNNQSESSNTWVVIG